MSTKKETTTFKKIEPPVKKREQFVQIGVYQLFGKKELPASEKKGAILRPLDPVTGKVDYTQDGYLFWFSQMDALKTGGVWEIPALLVPAKDQPKPEA